jgi:hypothetical protein
MQPHITSGQLSSQRAQLVAFSEFGEEDIRKVWGSLGSSTKTDDLAQLQYDPAGPLCHKLIFRFRQYDRSPSRFAHGIDPGKQQFILFRYRLERDVVEFFAWLKNGLGIYDLYMLLIASDGNASDQSGSKASIAPGDGASDQPGSEADGEQPDLEHFGDSLFYQQWRTNEVLWFFALGTETQEQLITRYNHECVDAYNQIVQRGWK